MVIDFGTLLVGTLLGLALGAAIVLFLILAAINAAKDTGEQTRHSRWQNSVMWSHVSKHELQRALHTMGQDPDSIEW